MKMLVTATSAVMLSFAAHAEENPLQFDRNACMVDGAGTLSLRTLPMPKGWFTSKNTFDRTKTDLRISYTLEATSCVQGAGDATFSSTTLGTFLPALDPVLNPQSKDIGYVWNMTADLSAAQNHWNNYFGCDGLPVVVGCPEARGLTFTIGAYGKDGQCRTFVDGLGAVQCAEDMVQMQLLPVQDPDQRIDPTLCQTGGCGIGDCVSARVSNGGICDQTFPENWQVDPNNSHKTYDANKKARSDCKTGASCYCKALLPPTCVNDGNDCQ